jgi:MerR HTH family regulatory protein
MNLLLIMHGYPPSIIRKRDRLAYISALETAQLGGAKDAYEAMILKAAGRSLDIYLSAARGESALGDVDGGRLMKIGELAEAAGESVATIRHWTKAGLLEVAEVTAAGYQLFAADMAARCADIRRMQGERLTLAEIGGGFHRYSSTRIAN